MKLKTVLVGMLKVGMLTIAMFISFGVAAGLSGLSGAAVEPVEEGGRQAAAAALFFVCFVNSLVLAYPIVRSRWYGLKLIGAVALVHFGAQAFMAQIEAVAFSDALKLPAGVLRGMALSGALTALFFSPAAVLILGKRKARGEPDPATDRLVMPWRAWVLRFASLALAYVCLYILFGYFVAWQSPAVREFYTGSTAILPFFAHMLDMVKTTPWFIPFQILRGLLWVGLALPVVRMMKGRSWETSLALGLLFSVLLTSQLLMPNAYMPADVRMTHLLETSTSTFLFGWLAGWLLCRKTTAGATVERDETAAATRKDSGNALTVV